MVPKWPFGVMESALSCSHWSEGGFTPNPYVSYPAALQWLNKGKEVLHQLPLSHFPSWSKYSNWLKKSSFSNLKAIIIRPVMPSMAAKYLPLRWAQSHFHQNLDGNERPSIKKRCAPLLSFKLSEEKKEKTLWLWEKKEEELSDVCFCLFVG